jgi:hypothetical protein
VRDAKRVTVQIPTASGDARRRACGLRHSVGCSGRPGAADRRLGRSDDVPAQERDPAVRAGAARPPRLIDWAPADLHSRARDGTPWHDRVAARSLLSFSWRRPVRRDASVRIPLLLVVPEADSIAPVPAGLEVARKAPRAELFRSIGGHYDVYEGGRLRRRAAHGDRLPSSSRPDRIALKRRELESPLPADCARSEWSGIPFASRPPAREPVNDLPRKTRCFGTHRNHAHHSR